ncbi:MAG TPA: AraC family transcriptional regulator [Burkholderiales bacterium]|nr:AraC family transcriptional regulator [Burkholderiales bacterium]
MTMRSTLLGSGAGWSVEDKLCSAGPHDRPFEEQRDSACIALVTEGIFRYRCRQGEALLAPGTLLLGNAREHFECAHEHHVGDRCLSFRFTPELLETIAVSVPRVCTIDFVAPRLPPLTTLAMLRAEMQMALDMQDAPAFEELALRLAGEVLAALAGSDAATPSLSRRDEQRIAAVLRQIEARAHERLMLSGLAHAAAMSPYHFLRTFRMVVGVTPHQYILRTRLHRAAVELRRSQASVATIAFAAGFDDLSTFNRHFRRLMGTTPSAYRNSI